MALTLRKVRLRGLRNAAPCAPRPARRVCQPNAPPPTLGRSAQVADWIAFRKDLEHVNAAWMIMPVGNAVAAYVGPLISVSNLAPCWQVLQRCGPAGLARP